MSFEGYFQVLCKNGHLTIEGLDYSYLELLDWRCPQCKEGEAWHNLVDTTNGSWDNEGNRIDGEVKLEILRKKICEHCGTLLKVIYQIPKKEVDMLSETEQELYDFIERQSELVTPNQIKEQLGEKYLGAIGKLIQNERIEKTQKWSNKDEFSRKLIKGYKIKNEKEDKSEDTN